jgi:hypothetical protein
MDICRTVPPTLQPIAPGHAGACHLIDAAPAPLPAAEASLIPARVDDLPVQG